MDKSIDEGLLKNILSLFVCKSCGMTPLDSAWNWCNWESDYRGEHYLDGSSPEPCGPVVLKKDMPDVR